MYHSITFGDGTLTPEGKFAGTNTWDDWHLIPSTRPVVASPGVSTNFIAVPGRSGSLDFSEWLTGAPVYGDRSGSFEFYVDNDHEDWISIKDKIFTFLHGKRMKMCLEDDWAWMYEGRFSVKEWKNDSWNSMVTIDYVLAPFKIYINPSEWYWDPTNFDLDTTEPWNEKRRL